VALSRNTAYTTVKDIWNGTWLQKCGFPNITSDFGKPKLMRKQDWNKGKNRSLTSINRPCNKARYGLLHLSHHRECVNEIMCTTALYCPNRKINHFKVLYFMLAPHEKSVRVSVRILHERTAVTESLLTVTFKPHLWLWTLLTLTGINFSSFVYVYWVQKK